MSWPQRQRRRQDTAETALSAVDGRLARPLLELGTICGVPLLLATLGCLMTACFIPAPIDETPEPENLPPTVDQRLDIFPADQREVFIELDFANPEPFGVRRVSDPNEEQTLYWRALVDYGAQVISSPTTTIDGDERELVQQFQFKPCEFPYRGAGEGATNLLLFFVVADEPFEDETSFFFGEDRLESATRTIGERPVEMVVWGVTLVGACRDF